MKTLKAAKIDLSDYFSHLLTEDMEKIAEDLRKDHAKDMEGDVMAALEGMTSSQEGNTANQLAFYGNLLKINFSRMDPYELKTFTDIIEKYSKLPQNTVGNGRGRGKKKA